jgi:uncharacterized protein (DUF2062 family)
VFRRRVELSWIGKMRAALAPVKGWRRGFAYAGYRVRRLPDTPHRIALGFACGVMASFTPFFTLHFVIAALLALTLRANVLASALGTFVGNPLTFPFIAWASLEVGDLLIGSPVEAEAFHIATVFTDVSAFLDRVFLPYLVGGCLPGLAAAVAAYLLVRPVVAAYQSRRREKLMAAARARVALHLKTMKRGKVVEAAD